MLLISATVAISSSLWGSHFNFKVVVRCPKVCVFFQNVFVYLRDRVTERMRKDLHPPIHFQNTAMVGAGPVKSWNPGTSGPPMLIQNPRN